MKLFSYHWGPDAAPQTWLFLHGLGGTGALWRPIAAELESECSVYAFDQRGHGKSQIQLDSMTSARPTYTPLDYGRDALETLVELGAPPVWVVGHSMGVRSAAALAHLAPDRVLGLVLVDLGFSGPVGGGLGSALETFLVDLPPVFSTRAEARAHLESRCPDRAINQYLMAVLTQDPRTNDWRFPFDHGALLSTLDAVRNTSIDGWLHAFQKPILALRGEHSTVLSADAFASEERNFAKDSHVTFETFSNCGHGLPFERRLEFVTRLRAFASSRLT